MIKVKIVGACGYGGIGILELLLRHPETNKNICLVDIENIGQSISNIYPHLAGACELKIVDPSDPIAQQPFDIVFMATPDGVGMKLAPAEMEKGAKIIDFSGDFRFNTPDDYALYAGRIGRDPKHASPELLPLSVYGLAELHREQLMQSPRIVGNPGCFAVSCILGLAPAVKHRIIYYDSIICDCKTGVSGAGKKPNPVFHYPARYEQMNAYKLQGHQHVFEIERELSLLANEQIRITFTSHVVPVCRGIMSTLYGTLTKKISEKEVLELYTNFYKNDKFIRVYPSNAPVGTVHVRTTNYCNLVVSIDERTHRLRIVSYIDNLMKGQAGSALQNMNLICGLPEGAGLEKFGVYP